MSTQKIKVHYKQKTQTFDFDLIENLQELRFAVSLGFINLPKSYEIALNNPEGNALTNQQIQLMKQYGPSDVKLFIKVKHDENDIESIASDLQKIEILERNDFNHDSQIKPQSNRKASYEQQRDIGEKKDQINRIEEALRVQKEINENKPQVLNEDVQCNGCFVFPIEGTIYKCLVCPDYDLCEKCEALQKHYFHPLLKITKKNQYPIHIKTVFSKKSKAQMEKLAKQYHDEMLNKLKNRGEGIDYKIIDPSTLKSVKVCTKNFLSEIIDFCD